MVYENGLCGHGCGDAVDWMLLEVGRCVGYVVDINWVLTIDTGYYYLCTI